MANADRSETVVWQLTAKRSSACCIVEPLGTSTLLTLLHDGEVVSRETFATSAFAHERAASLRAALEMKGWRVDAATDAQPSPSA